MKCPHEDCARSNDCGILEITNKVPQKGSTCSYFVPIKKANKEEGSK